MEEYQEDADNKGKSSDNLDPAIIAFLDPLVFTGTQVLGCIGGDFLPVLLLKSLPGFRPQNY